MKLAEVTLQLRYRSSSSEASSLTYVVKKLSAFLGQHMFITVFTTATFID
jgi:hypothetical protein